MRNTGRIRKVCDYIRSHRDQPLKLGELARPPAGAESSFTSKEASSTVWRDAP